MRTILLLSLLILCGAALAAPESAPQHQAQLVQGAFDSSSDQQSLQRALAKAFGREVRISVENVAAGDGAAGDLFGNSVALSGDTALVGMIGDDTLAGANAGSAYVFTRTGTQWSQQAKLTASDGAAGDRFGMSVALSGDTALVGASLDDTPAGVDAGSAYVFTRSGTAWSEQQRLNAGDGAASDEFGRSVALSGNTALVGAYFTDTPAGADAGSAYIFTRPGPLWSQQSKLTASDGAASDEFGYSVALSGTTALVGAYRDDSAVTGNLDLGSAYLYTDNPNIFIDGFESVP